MVSSRLYQRRPRHSTLHWPLRRTRLPAKLLGSGGQNPGNRAFKSSLVRAREARLGRTGVEVGVRVGVGVEDGQGWLVGVIEGVGVTVRVAVGDGPGVAVSVAVDVGVTVADGSGVRVVVAVSVGVALGVAVKSGVSVGVGVRVRVGQGVGERRSPGVGVRVRVGVRDGKLVREGVRLGVSNMRVAVRDSCGAGVMAGALGLPVACSTGGALQPRATTEKHASRTSRFNIRLIIPLPESARTGTRAGKGPGGRGRPGKASFRL